MAAKTQVELFRNCITELAPLFYVHWRELGLFQDKMPLSPQYEEYIRQEASGTLILITIRKEGLLIGYITIQIVWGLHYRTTPTALTDIVYVAKEYRNRGYALPLFKRAEKELKLRGVKYWMSGFKEHSPLGMPEFLSAFGFAPADIHYSKWIG